MIAKTVYKICGLTLQKESKKTLKYNCSIATNVKYTVIADLFPTCLYHNNIINFISLRFPLEKSPWHIDKPWYYIRIADQRTKLCIRNPHFNKRMLSIRFFFGKNFCF